jgi:hypothetical protein
MQDAGRIAWTGKGKQRAQHKGQARKSAVFKTV